MTRDAPPTSHEAETKPTSPAEKALAEAALERPTMVPCPSCDGIGFVVLESGPTQHRGVACDLCRSLGMVTVLEMRAFLLGQKARERRTP